MTAPLLVNKEWRQACKNARGPAPSLRSHRRQTVDARAKVLHRLAAVATFSTAWQRWLRFPPLGSGGYEKLPSLAPGLLIVLFREDIAILVGVVAAATLQAGAIHQAATQYFFDMVVVRRRRAESAQRFRIVLNRIGVLGK